MRILFIFLLVFLLYRLQGSLYIRNCFKHVSADLSFSLHGIFEGEKAELIEVFYNKKMLPLWWVGVKFALSRYLVFEEEENENEGNDNYRKDLFFMNSYERVTKRFILTGAKRGYYKVEQLELNSGDFFGLFRAIRSYPACPEIYVYPKLIPSQEIDIYFKRMNGDILTKRHVVEDPFQLRGIREYHPYDSLKMVNWNATAKSGDLKVNQYNYTASQEVVIFLNIERYNAWDPERIVEECISLTASLAAKYIEMGMKVEVLTNGCDIVTAEPIHVLSGSGLSHNMTIYENLARIDINKVIGPVAALVEDRVAGMNKEPVLILVSHYFGEKVVEQVEMAKSYGFDLKWILPKTMDTKINLDMEDLYIWEVKDI